MPDFHVTYHFGTPEDGGRKEYEYDCITAASLEEATQIVLTQLRTPRVIVAPPAGRRILNMTLVRSVDIHPVE